MDIWSAGDEVAFSEVCACMEPLLFRYLLDETHNVELSQQLLDETLVRVEFGAYRHQADLVGWALEIAGRLASASVHRQGSGA